jgi:hypothetical protein
LQIVVKHDFNVQLFKWHAIFGELERMPAAVKTKRKKTKDNKRKTAPA